MAANHMFILHNFVLLSDLSTLFEGVLPSHAPRLHEGQRKEQRLRIMFVLQKEKQSQRETDQFSYRLYVLTRLTRYVKQKHSKI